MWLPWNTRRSLAGVFAWCLGIIVAFSLLYAVVPTAGHPRSVWDCLYLSVTVFTTLGHNDLAHLSPLGQGLVMLEVACGYLLLGVFVSVFSRRILGE